MKTLFTVCRLNSVLGIKFPNFGSTRKLLFMFGNRRGTLNFSFCLQECDVVLMFPSGTTDSTLMWLLSRFRAGTPGLVAHVRHHSSSDSYGFYLTAPFNV